nr:hypothetical protein [Marinicella sp. W31]MDC2877045.1 hypothetical protein [Marinicella sp. W31]
MEKKSPDDRPKILKTAVVTTIVILVLEGLIILATGWPERAEGWGDFLAGAFAPLAFVWLIAAVFIQSNELREQRAELKLTRREFELNRNVMESQAEEARRQAEYVGQQTAYLKEQNALHAFNTALAQFAAQIEADRETLNQHRKGTKIISTTMINWRDDELDETSLLLRFSSNLDRFASEKPVPKWITEGWESNDPDGHRRVLAAAERLQNSASMLKECGRSDPLIFDIDRLFKNLSDLKEQALGEND